MKPPLGTPVSPAEAAAAQKNLASMGIQTPTFDPSQAGALRAKIAEMSARQGLPSMPAQGRQMPPQARARVPMPVRGRPMMAEGGKVKGYAKGGKIDGCAQRGKTRGKVV